MSFLYTIRVICWPPLKQLLVAGKAPYYDRFSLGENVLEVPNDIIGKEDDLEHDLYSDSFELPLNI
jgi:hypothetical protein